MNDLITRRSEFPEDERTKNVHSVEGSQFSTFIRVKF